MVALSSLALAAAACGRESEQTVQNEAANEVEIEQDQAATLDPADMPPPIVRSASYRCDDGQALYVAVLQEKHAVLVRDSRSDIPTRLERESDTGPLTADDGTSLSGTGSEVRYSSPDRPSQTCREAAA